MRRLPASPIPWMVALNVMGVNLISPVLPAYASHFGVGFAVISSLLTAFALARMSVRVAAGTLSDRHGSGKVCAAGGVIQLVGALLAGFAPSIGVLIGARAMHGVGTSLFGTSINRQLLVETEKADLGRATARYHAGIVIGSTLGPLVGGVLADTLGIFAPFFLHAAVSAFLAVATFRLLGHAGLPQSEPSTRTSVGRLLRLEGFTLILLLGFGLFFIEAGATNVLVPAFADEVLALSPSVIGAIISVGSVTSFLTMPVAGRLADSIGATRVALVGGAGTALGVAAYALAGQPAHLGVVAGATGLGVGLTRVAIGTMVGHVAPPGTEGLATGISRLASDAGYMVGPLALGLLADRARFDLAFVIAGLPLLLGSILLVAGQVSTSRGRAG